MKKRKKRKDYVLNQLRKANTMLLDASNALDASTSKSGIKEQIDAIETSIDKIIKWLNY